MYGVLYLLLNCIIILVSIDAIKINLSNARHFIGIKSEEKAEIYSENQCSTLEENFLVNILGAAFNPRYMSINRPADQDDDNHSSDMKRMSSGYRSFTVDEDFNRAIKDETPAWEMDHSSMENYFDVNGRVKKSVGFEYDNAPPPWECKSRIKWIDLGFDYFPRYLRSVECEKHECWYGRYACRPKSFTVKILRRKRGKCAYTGKKTTVFDLPRELRELWVWEERAVSFCCECSP